MRRIWPVVPVVFCACFGHSDDVTDPVDARGDAPPIDGGGFPDAPPIDAPGVDAPAGGNAGFVTPTAITKANVNSGGQWTEVGDADWSCHGTASTDQPSTGTIALSGRIEDFQTGNGVGMVTVEAWSWMPTTVVGTAITSGLVATRGDYTMTLGMLPAGTRRYGFTLSADQYVTTRVVDVYYPPGAPATGNHDIVSEGTATALPAFIGITRDTSKGFFVGTVVDCQGRRVSNAVVGISTQPGTFANAGGTTFYFSAGSSSLPVRHNVSPVSNRDGQYLLVNADPTPAVFVQVWGFRSTAELGSGNLTLLGQVRAAVDANVAVVANLEALRN